MSKKKPHALAGYAGLLSDIKSRIQQAQTRAMLSVNAELVRLYWDIGRLIVERQHRDGWGVSVTDRLSADLRKAFPGLKGFSPSNVSRMRAFYLAYQPAAKNLPKAEANPLLVNSAQAVPKLKGRNSAQAVPKLVSDGPPPLVAAIPWGHNVVLLFKLSDNARRLWYASQTLAHGWSRAILTVQIDSDLYARQGKATTNFDRLLPSPQSDLAQQTLKDPYIFDFLTLSEPFRERELELSLLLHVEKFLLELGQGFAFVGRQYRITIGDEEFSIDLLFYHLKLRSFVVIDLKTGAFKAEYAGKMNLYLGAIDDQLRHASDSPTVGLILCQDRNRVVAEYALRGMTQPIGVSEYELTRVLPRELESSLPSIDEIEAELSGSEVTDRPAKRRPVKKKVKRKAAKS